MSRSAAGVVLALALVSGAAARAAEREPVLGVHGVPFDSWQEYVHSEYFQAVGARCGTPSLEPPAPFWRATEGEADGGGTPADCSAGNTNPDPGYEPGPVIEIPVVVHILRADNCTTGEISNALVDSQIEILNEDFLALVGTPGEPGIDTAIQFHLADVDPNGLPTDGITRSCNTAWFNDQGPYWESLAWDPHRFLNVYTNTAGGFLGYVPFLPASNPGGIGQLHDRVVVHWQAFGRDAPGGPPYDQGRTLTHEVGHYLGLYHVFQGGCGSASPPGCYGDGDRICDSHAQQSPNFGCPVNPMSCGTPDNPQNYLDYSDDLCMNQFTQEQKLRLRCTVEHYRPDLGAPSPLIFADGFESGDTSSWSTVVP